MRWERKNGTHVLVVSRTKVFEIIYDNIGRVYRCYLNGKEFDASTTLYGAKQYCTIELKGR